MCSLVQPAGVKNSDPWFRKLSDAGWLKHVRAVLHASVRVCEILEFEGRSVLNHCSDGWDRTAQIVAMVRIHPPRTDLLTWHSKKCWRLEIPHAVLFLGSVSF